MGIQKWSDNIILINLAAEPQMGEELQTVTGMVTEKGDYDVVVDFADIDIVTSSSIAKLLKLRKVLKDCDHRLLFSTIKPQTMSIFAVTGLENVFEFVDDQFVALASLQFVV
jgi:anti-anti-sigma regulatory factor